MRRALPFLALFLVAVVFSGDCACERAERVDVLEVERLRAAYTLWHAADAISNVEWGDESRVTMYRLALVLRDHAAKLADAADSLKGRAE